MPSPKSSVSFWAPVRGADVAIAVGNIVLPDANNSGDWVVSTTANRAGRRSEAVAVSSTSGAGFGPFELQEVGTIDAEISKLPAAAGRSLVRCSDVGTFERVATDDVDPEEDDVIGYAEPNGRVHLCFGVPLAEIAALGGGGATPGGSVGDIQVRGPDNTFTFVAAPSPTGTWSLKAVDGVLTWVSDVAPPTPIDGVQFTGSQAFYAASASGTTLGTAHVRFRLDEMPTSYAIVAGPNNGGGVDGWLVWFEDTFGGSVNPQLVVYAGISGTLTRVARKFLMPADVGRVMQVDLVCDGTKVWVYLDGKKINAGTAATAITPSTSPMNIGGRSSGAHSAKVTVCDVSEGTTALTPSEVAALVASGSSVFAGQTHRWVASAGITTAWNDEVGTAHLSRLGTPAGMTIAAPVKMNHRGAVEVWGDSIAAGRESGGVTGNGWRRAVQRACSDAGKAITFVGPNTAGAATVDFDFWTSATGSETIQSRLATLASDLASTASSDTATLFAYGVNDILSGRTAAQVRADLTTAVGYANTARPGRPICVCNVLSVATSQGTSGQRAEIASFQSGFAAFGVTLQATFPNVVMIDTAPAVTDANDTGQVYDGVHPSPTTYTAMANIIAPAIIGAM